MVSQLQLIEQILESLSYNGRIPDQNSMDTGLIDQVVSSCHIRWLDTSALKDIIADIAFEKMLSDHKSNREKLSEAENKEIAKDIEDTVHALPEEYSFYFQMPSSALVIPRLSIGPRMEIYSAEEDLQRPASNRYKTKPQTAKEKAALSLLGTLSQPLPIYKKGDVVLEIKSSGLITKYSKIILDTLDPLYFYKVILYMLDVQNSFVKATHASSVYGVDPAPLSYSAVVKGNYMERTFRGDSGDTRYVATKSFHQPMLELDQLGTFSMRAEIIRKLLNKPAEGSSQDLVEFQRRLRNAAYWSYEAKKASETHLRIVYTCTALDALIGSQTDTKDHKAEVISQAISKNLSTETDHKEAVTKLYSIRNGIVHGSVDINTLQDCGTYSDDSSILTLFKSQLILRNYFINRLGKFTSTA